MPRDGWLIGNSSTSIYVESRERIRNGSIIQRKLGNDEPLENDQKRDPSTLNRMKEEEEENTKQKERHHSDRESKAIESRRFSASGGGARNSYYL